MNAGNIPTWANATHWASASVLFILALLSIWSVATMIQSYRLLKKARGGVSSDEIFLLLHKELRNGDIAAALKNGGTSLYGAVLQEALAVKIQEPFRIDRTLKSVLVLRKTSIERGLTTLATIGANAPFVGLFGTVLGIIQAFSSLGANQSSGSLVMVGISEALVATAVGLFVAIPAVVAFNFFSRSLRVLITNCEALRDLYVAQLKE